MESIAKFGEIVEGRDRVREKEEEKGKVRGEAIMAL